MSKFKEKWGELSPFVRMNILIILFSLIGYIIDIAFDVYIIVYLALLLPLLVSILAIKALLNIKKRHGKGKIFSWIVLILAILMLMQEILWIILLFSRPPLYN